MHPSPTELEAAIDQVTSQCQQAFSALTRPDGRAPVFSADETRERETAIRSAYHQGMAAISASVSAITGEAEAELTAITATDPTDRFSTEALERISLRTPIVAEDLAHQPEVVQLQRLRAALTASETERYIALRAGRTLLTKRAASVPQYRNGQPLADHSDLAQAVQELEATFVDQARRERAEARIAAVQGVSTKMASANYMMRTYGVLAAGRSLTR